MSWSFLTLILTLWLLRHTIVGHVLYMHSTDDMEHLVIGEQDEQ